MRELTEETALVFDRYTKRPDRSQLPVPDTIQTALAERSPEELDLRVIVSSNERPEAFALVVRRLGYVGVLLWDMEGAPLVGDAESECLTRLAENAKTWYLSHLRSYMSRRALWYSTLPSGATILGLALFFPFGAPEEGGALYVAIIAIALLAFFTLKGVQKRLMDDVMPKLKNDALLQGIHILLGIRSPSV